MPNQGFIYILINPSLAGLLKIGKTRRSPEGRASELSAATGVPTPFIVAFDEQFDDCDTAERYIHTLLQEKGYRVAENREFFRMPLKEAVKILLEAKSVLCSQNIRSNHIDELKQTSAKEHDNEHWRDVFEQAEAYLYGRGETLIDVKQAYKLLKQATTLGSSEACTVLASLHLDGMGCERSTDKALDYLKEAVRLGGADCYAPMAKLYYQIGQYENAGKCWKKYFTHLSNSNDELRQAAEENVIDYLQRKGHIPDNFREDIKDIWAKGPKSLHLLLIRAEVIYVILGRFGYPKHKVAQSVDEVLAMEGEYTVKSVYEQSLDLLRTK